MLLGTLGDSLLGSALTGWGVIRADEGRVRAGQHFSNFKLTIFEIKTYYENEPKCDGIYLRDNLTKVKDGTYAMSMIVVLELKICKKKFGNLFTDIYRIQA